MLLYFKIYLVDRGANFKISGVRLPKPMNLRERENRRRGYCGRVSAWSACKQCTDCHQILMESYRLLKAAFAARYKNR